ncbi:hypothetical protein [Corynebacterium glutamicum]|uniref:hypothetical protein n=1 Tax=Corynebacterium glutamicum TaxID=1718 RepID=UPI00094259ED|nr:hypothetical protein [Corynebacterium glutamicum]OKX85138.1 hypothetical protein AUO95_00975 [Corynebacterium glutamicum]
MTMLISDGGSMVVGRRTASYVYGAFEVTLPEGLEQQEPEDDRIADAYIYRPDDRGHGRGELTFVRADARIDMNAAKSDLEDTLDQASRRVDGAIFYSRELRGKSLARTRPGEDYVVGSVIDLLHWGKIITLPVTAISDLSTPADGHYHSVQVGGQAITDAEKLRKINDTLDNQIAIEKRQRLKAVGEVSKKAGQAQSTADGVRTDLDGTEVQAVEEDWAPPSTGWQGAVDTLNRNFLEYRAFQDNTNAELQARIQAHEDMILDLQDAKKRALASISRTVVSHGSAVADPQSAFIRASISGSAVRVEAIGSWKGTIAVEVISSRSVEGTSIAEPTHFWLTIPDPGFNRVWEQRFTGIGVAPLSVQAIANIQPGVMDEEGFPISHFLADRDRWHIVETFKTTRATEHTIMGSVGWHAATYDDTYGVRLVVGSQVVAQIAPRTRVGPLTILGNGYVKWVLDLRDRVIPAGTDIKLEVWAGATGNDQRTVRDGELRIWWIDEE